MGHGTSREQKKEAGGVGREKNLWELRETLGGREASGVDPDTHGVGGEEGGREASGVEEISTLELVLCCWKIL